jgi:Carboxymuconolactone decarboxylase family
MSHRLDYAKASPEGFMALGGVYASIQNSGLSKQLVDLVYLRVSQINGCTYCIDMHSRDQSGLALDKLVLLRCGARGASCSVSANVPLSLSRKLSHASLKPAFPIRTTKPRCRV